MGEFNMESFKRESSAMPEMPKITSTLPSYNLFNSAPYSPTTSRPGSAMSMSNERPFSASDHSAPPKTRTIKVSVAVDSTDDEDLPADAYLPQRSGGLKNKKKKDLGTGRRRATSTDVSDTESEDSCYQVYTNERMTPLEAKQKAEEGRQKAAEDEARLQDAVKEQLKREEEEEMIRQEELAVKKKEEDEKKK